MSLRAFTISACLSLVAFTAPAYAQEPSGSDLDADSITPLPLTIPGDWHESATRLYYNHELKLPWIREFGDYRPGVLGELRTERSSTGGQYRVTVSGNNLLLNCTKAAVFHSRESSASALRPTLTVRSPSGTHAYVATRDTSLAGTTLNPRGENQELRCPGNLLLAFDGYTARPGDVATLTLSASRVTQADVIRAYRPVVSPVLPTVPARAMTRSIVDLRARDFTPTAQLTISGDIAVARMTSHERTAMNQRFELPPAQEYFLTVVMKLGANWPDHGGKLPGLSNTGQAGRDPSRLIIDGQNCSQAGWGGRPANGCRWSARTGWNSRQGDLVGFSTYYYALNTGSGWGKGYGMPAPIPAGRWFAYVQRVRVNDVGESNGRMTYWRCSDVDCAAVFDKSDILFRTATVSRSLINEVWADIYCGGRDCGPRPIEPTQAMVRRLTVTDGLPDLAALAREVRMMNESGR